MDSPAVTVPDPAADVVRRRLLYGGVGVVAAAAGAGLAWWRTSLDASGNGLPLDPSFWNSSFETPQGTQLAMASFQGKPLLVNFWATWCPPCIEELPLIDSFFREHAATGWQVVGLAIDQPSAVRKFLGRAPLSFPVGLAGLDGTQLSKTLGNAAGALPFTVVLSAKGDVLHRKMGRILPAELVSWASQG